MLFGKLRKTCNRVTRSDENVNGRSHRKGGWNIWRLLNENVDRSLALHLHGFSQMELYLLSCAACCHDFGKGLTKSDLPDGFAHGDACGMFGCDTAGLGIASHGAGRSHCER